jgi:hypothetical protein
MRGYCSRTRTSKRISVLCDQMEHNYNVTLASLAVAWLNTHEEAHVGRLLISIPAQRQAHAHAPGTASLLLYSTRTTKEISPRSRWLRILYLKVWGTLWGTRSLTTRACGSLNAQGKEPIGTSDGGHGSPKAYCTSTVLYYQYQSSIVMPPHTPAYFDPAPRCPSALKFRTDCLFLLACHLLLISPMLPPHTTQQQLGRRTMGPALCYIWPGHPSLPNDWQSRAG